MSQQDDRKQRLSDVIFTLCIFAIVFLVSLSTFFVFETRNVIKENNYIGKNIDVADSMTFSGEATMKVSPDIARVSMGYYSEATTVAKAQKDVSEVIEKLQIKLQDIGINYSDIKTENYSVYPQYEYINSKSILKGYRVAQSVEVKIRDLDKSSDVLKLAGDLGLNEIGNLSFEVDGLQGYIDGLKEQAIKNAKNNAKEEARMLGVELGSISDYSFSSNGNNDYRVVYGLNKAMASYDTTESIAAPSITSGEQEIKVRVNITYRIR